jgi:hypothetical protein
VQISVMGSGMDKAELLEEIRLYGQMGIPRPWWKMGEELAMDKKISLDPPHQPNSHWRVATMIDFVGSYNDPD